MTGPRSVVLSDAQARALVLGRFMRVELGARVEIEGGLRAKSAFVGRVGGKLYAYYNVCQHQPVELDLPLDPQEQESAPAVRRAPMADDGVHLMCHSHGALYRPTDGRCVLGPCYGASLVALDVEDQDGRIVLRLDPAPKPT